MTRQIASRRRSDRLETGARISGTFEIEADRAIFGELTLESSQSRLYLRDDDFFHTLSLPDGYLKGHAHDLSCLSLFNCITLSGPGSGMAGDTSFSFAELFPHEVVQGSVHLGPGEEKIRSVIFSIDDGHALFHDFDALGTVLNPDPLITAVASANRKVTGRKARLGPRPLIHYFAGRSRLLSANTSIGQISVLNLVDETIGSPRRMAFESRIGLEIGWRRPVALPTALSSVGVLIRFFELLTGKPQNRKNLLLRVDHYKSPAFLSIYSSMLDQWPRGTDERSPSVRDVLIDGVRRRNEMKSVLRSWLSLDAAREDARQRFAHGFRNENRFSEDRLIGAANMFDLLPADAVPQKVTLSRELSEAKRSARALFEPLRASPERDSILSALGRLGTSSLPRKVLHRAKIVTDALPELKADMGIVVREAIRCRNHYVHGSDGSYDYLADGDALPFFTDALEFVFGASELVECGWDIAAFRARGGSHHPFAELIRSWGPRVDAMKTQLGAAKRKP